MMKSALAILVVCGTVSAVEAMPVAAPATGGALSVTKAAVVIKKVVRRRPAVVVRRPAPRVVKKVIVR